ncbi:hypothetical protein IV498_10160 [Paenarthrobacter sp. Z7-10]|uniref:hypothetical protein n=1 Tax=Paenarthrobacter sp. Z7-10 TaxID=2787635 RepID=UPI0022A90D89|nr:hypothetical protein [Paenarthrobacter sp. Z7-10]MCZ2403533.1 hypothetical protein [Paenarthrobacter sp. Z7-10]
MTDAMKDRPELLVRRGPKPAPDEKIDPVEIAPAPREMPTASSPAEPVLGVRTQSSKKIGRPAGKREITVPLGTRLSIEVMEVLDDAVVENGISIRAAVEQAILSRWGKN